MLSAARASLLNPVKVHGANTYTFGTNVLSWDNTCTYTLQTVAEDFGEASSVPGSTAMQFKCGESYVGTFDFGLLFTCFVAINSAFIEQGESVSTHAQETSTNDIGVVWFGSNAIVYSKTRTLVIPIKSTEIQSICRMVPVEVACFTTVDKYTIKREYTQFSVYSKQGEAVCTFHVPDFIKRTYPNLFDDDPSNDEIVDDPATPWDERSGLGSLIAGSIHMTSAEAMFERYEASTTLESVVVRSDLMCEPHTRYSTTEGFFGSLCYMPEDIIALVVNCRGNMLVYRPWFTGDKPSGIQVTMHPQLSEFYDVTAECKLISQFAKTVGVVPLTAAQFDISMFEKVKQAFYDMELPRFKLASAFGRVVIPESVLAEALCTSTGESAYCIVPVGSIGKNLVCKTATGGLDALRNMRWPMDGYFYDITEVVR